MPRAVLGLTVFIGLKVERHSQETWAWIEHALLAIPAIVACAARCHWTTGGVSPEAGRPARCCHPSRTPRQ